MLVKNDRIKRSDFCIFPNTQDNEKQNKKETITGRQLSRTPKIFKKSVTKDMKKKIKRWFRIEMKNQSSLQFLEVMKVLSD